MSKCELCSQKEGVYDATVLADCFGRTAIHSDDGTFYVCFDCLDEVAASISEAWRSNETGLPI